MLGKFGRPNADQIPARTEKPDKPDHALGRVDAKHITIREYGSRLVMLQESRSLQGTCIVPRLYLADGQRLEAEWTLPNTFLCPVVTPK